MKKLANILIAIAMMFTLTSCVTSVQAQTDDMYDDVTINTVITLGVPYYNADGLIIYYLYRNMYYYPYYYGHRYYFHRYTNPLPPSHLRHYRPIPRNYFHRHPIGKSFGNRPIDRRPSINRQTPPNMRQRSSTNSTPRMGNSMPSGGRPQMRQSAPMHNQNGHFGGARNRR